MRIVIAMALAVATPAAAQTPTWAVAPSPITVVGTTTGDADQELVGVLGAYRQGDGHLIIAASSPLQLRRYGSRGTFVALVGHQGAGPGEYRGRLSLYAGRADSILIYDDAISRWTLYLPTGTVARSWLATAAERQHFAPVAYRRTLIHPTGSAVPACFRTLIDALPLPRDTAYREAFPDGVDRAWFREEGVPEWTVRSLAGRTLGRVTLPDSFELLQIGQGFVVGRRRDSDGLERVEVLRVTMPAHSRPPDCASRSDSFPADPSPIVRTLDIDLRNLESAGEAFRSDYRHYAMTLDSIQHASGFRLSTGTAVHLLAARDGLGWDAVARSDRAPGWCRMLIGDIAPIWMYRFAFCGR
jgi:hypothetical protein